MSRRALTAAVAVTIGSLIVAVPAAAHGLVGKQDLPIPRWLFGWAAAVVLVISFVGLASLWPTARLDRARERRLLGLPRILDPLCGALGVLTFAGLVYAGLAGSQTATANALPTVVYVTFWVAIPFASLVFGDVFRAFNPWRAGGRATGWVANRLAGEHMPFAMAYPERLGRWPAALGILCFAVLELAVSVRDDPSTLAILALLYALVQFVGMGLYGVRAWTERGDAFGVYFGLFGSLAALHWTRRALYLRAPLTGTATVIALPGTIALLCVMIGSTSFDGLTANALWASLGDSLRTTYFNLGLSGQQALELAFFTGLLGMVGVIAGLYLLGCTGCAPSPAPSSTAPSGWRHGSRRRSSRSRWHT